jgi:ComF family protein
VDDNPIMKIFYGRIPLKSATSFLFFEKGSIVQQIMHYLKYKNQESISTFLGDWMGQELKEEKAYTSVDVVVPVPLHKKKLRKRGYNQVAGFGKQLAKHLDAVYIDDLLIKSTKTKTQTFKDRVTRWYQNKHLFQVTNTSMLQNKHILLVDDIITTGATIEACATALNSIPGITISVASMAYTK